MAGMGVRAFILCVPLCAGTATGAAAEDRYAAPTGTGTACTQVAPCDIDQAVEGTGAGAGDVVKLLPGTYMPDEAPGSAGRALGVTADLTIEPAEAGTRPTITATGLTAVVVFAADAVVRDLTIRAVNGAAIDLQSSSLVEGVYASVNSGQTPISLRNGTVVRDSVAWAPHASGVAVRTGGTGAVLDNVTAVGGFRGIAMDSNNTSPDTTQAVTLTNTIAVGAAAAEDIWVRESSGGTAEVAVSLDHSNYDDLVNSGAEVTETAIQTAPPIFLTPSLGNFHQLESSPTVNAGTVQPSTAARRDLDGELRFLGSAPDIGADEVTEAPPPPDPPTTPGPSARDTTPLETTITKAPKKKLKLKSGKRRAKVGIEFAASVPGATFTCRLDRKPAKPCASPFKAKVKKGRHTFAVAAVDASGNTDPTPASARWKVKRKRR